MRTRYLLGAVLALLPVAALANESITYSYDAKGRLVTAAHSGSAVGSVVARYTFDKADNRTELAVTGSVSTTPERVVVLPIGGFQVVKLPE